MGSFLSKLDPTGNDFLGAGKKVGRAIGGVATWGFSELARPDPLGAGRNTVFSKSIGGSVTGAAAGIGTGFVVGGPWGALLGGVLGAVGGGIAGGVGATKNYTPLGFVENAGIGVGAGLTGGAAAHLGWAAAPTVGPSLPSLPTVASPTFSFGSLAGLKTALGTVAGASVLKKLLTPAQIATLGLPSSGQDSTVSTPANLTPSTNVSSYLLPTPTGNAGATSPIILNTTTPAAQQSYLWILIVLALVGAYLYFKKKKR